MQRFHATYKQQDQYFGKNMIPLIEILELIKLHVASDVKHVTKATFPADGEKMKLFQNLDSGTKMDFNPVCD